MKFGGTSVGSAQAIEQVVGIVASVRDKKPIVVVSAVATITDALIRLAEETARKEESDSLSNIRAIHARIIADLGLDSSLCEREMQELGALVSADSGAVLDAEKRDAFQSFGERMSARIVAAALTKHGVAAQAFDAWDIGMITTDRFGNAEPLPSSYGQLREALNAIAIVPVITGFIGKTVQGEVTTLGRGGTDYTAAIIGAAVSAEAIQIWKEVDGFMTTDPRIVPEARVVPELAFEEAAELAYFGAKVLHPKTIIPAMRANVPVQVLNTFKPEERGTTIVSNFAQRKLQSCAIEALTFRKGVIVMHIYSPEFFDGNGLMARIFNVCDQHKTSVDIITTSVASVSITTTDESHIDAITAALQDMGTIEIEREKAAVCAVGGSMDAAGVVGKMFTVLGEGGVSVEMISQAASGYSVTFVVSETDAQKAVTLLHRAFIKAGT